MDAHGKEDSVSRELRGFELARRLIFHHVRTRTVSKLTGLSVNRLATFRRRLMVPKDARHRGPPPCSLDVLLRTARGRTEGAALAALFPLFDRPTGGKPMTSLDEAQQLCEIYDAYLALYPQSQVQFEELMLLKKSVAQGDLIELKLCRRCRGLIMNFRSHQDRRACWHCDTGSEPARTLGRGPASLG